MGCKITTKWSNTISSWLGMEELQGKDGCRLVRSTWCYSKWLNISCTWKILWIWCKSVKKGVLYLPFWSCACITTREHSLSYIGNFIYINAEAYSETNHTSTMKFFCENSQRLKTWTDFAKRLHHRCSTGL